MGSFPSVVNIRSEAVEHHLRLQTTLSECDAIRSVDRFITIAFKNVKKDDAIRSIVDHPIAFETLVEYLYLNMHDKVNNILANENVNIDSPGNSDISVRLRICIKDAFKDTRDIQQSLTSKYPILELLFDAFPKYLKSQFFCDWRAKEILNTTTFSSSDTFCKLSTTLPELKSVISSKDGISAYFNASASLILEKVINGVDIITPETELSDVSQSTCPIASEIGNYIEDKETLTFIEQALEFCDQVEVPRLLQSNNWLMVFLAAAEYLPIGISLSLASTKRPNFPLVYVNKEIERMLGYKRTSLIENNCKFGYITATTNLNSNFNNSIINLQKENLIQLFQSLENAQSLVITLINSRGSNGEYFTNIIGVKPIIDQNSDHIYNIGIHVEVARESSAQSRFNFVNSLMDSLPGPSDYFELIQDLY
eukprot:gene5247-10499_t